MPCTAEHVLQLKVVHDVDGLERRTDIAIGRDGGVGDELLLVGVLAEVVDVADTAVGRHVTPL